MRKSELWYYHLWMWRHVRTRDWSWLSKPTNSMSVSQSGFKIQKMVITGHSSQQRMNGPLWSMWLKFWGHSDIGLCGCRRGIWFHCITLFQSTMTSSIIWMVLCMHWLRRKTQRKQDLFFSVKLTQQRLPKYSVEATPTSTMLLLSTYIRDLFRKLRLSRRWATGMGINPKHETSYTTQYHDAIQKYVENECCTKNWYGPVNKHQYVPSNNPFSSTTAAGSGQTSSDWIDLSHDDEHYLMPTTVAETTPRRSDCTAYLLTAARLYLISPPEAPNNWGQIDPNVNDYRPDPIVISSTFCIPNITDWWHQQEDTHAKYANHPIVACFIFAIIPDGVGGDASLSNAWDYIRLRQSTTRGEILGEQVVIMKFAWVINRIFAGNDSALDMTNTENDSEMKNDLGERQLDRMAEVHDHLEMWQGSQYLHATLKESRNQNKQMTAVGYISHKEEIVKASWLLFQHDGAAAFTLSEKSPWPPALSTKDLPGEWTQILNVHQIR